MEDKFKPEPTEEEIQVAEKLLPEMEDLLYKNPEEVADLFLNNKGFRELLTSRKPEEMAKAEKIAKEQNTTTNEIIKKKLVEILKGEHLNTNTK